MANRGNIAEFNAGDGKAFEPRDIGSEIQHGARSIAEMGNQTANLYKQGLDRLAEPIGNMIDQHETRDDIGKGAATGAAIFNNQMDAWNKILSQASPNDDLHSIQQKFLNDTLEPQLQTYQSGFQTEKGQDWGLDRADEMRKQFYTKTSADITTMSGEAAKLNAITFIKQTSSSAYKDHANADYHLQQIDAYVDGIKQNGTWDAKQLSEFDKVASDGKNETVKATVKGLADGTPGQDNGRPDDAIKLLNSGHLDKYMNGDEKAQLVSYADGVANAQELARKQAAAEKQYKNQQANEQGTKSIFGGLAQGQTYSATTAFSDGKLTPEQRTDFVSTNPKYPGILQLPKEVLNSTQYGPGFSMTREALINGNPVTPAGLTKGVRMNGVPAQQDQALTPAGAVALQEIQDKMKTPEGAYEVQMQTQVLQQLQSQLKPGGDYIKDQNGDSIYDGMQSSFHTLWDSEIKAGKTPAQLADPDSKDYIGNAFMTLKRSDAQALADVTSANVADKDYLTQLQDAKEKQQAPTLTTKEQFDKLAPGKYYMRDGKLMQKPEEKKE